MAATFLSPSPSLSSSTSIFPQPPPLFFRKGGGASSPFTRRYRVQENAVFARHKGFSEADLGFSLPIKRRELMLLSLSFPASLALHTPVSVAEVEQDGNSKMATFMDDLNAYSFLYPVEVPSKKFAFKWIESRKPERYSSAAPLSPDARQRIVSERVDMIHNVVISVSIGPPSSRLLPSKDKNTWNAKDVAESVLSDKSALRVTTSQKVAESSVLDTHSSAVDGEPYWYYEYLVRKSPTKSAQESNIFRHYVASTAERDGYLYSLSASTLSKQWDFMGPLLEKTVASFRLLPATDNYVPPFKDPWRFW